MINLSTIQVTFILVLSKKKTPKKPQKTPNYIQQILRIKRKRKPFTPNIMHLYWLFRQNKA